MVPTASVRARAFSAFPGILHGFNALLCLKPTEGQERGGKAGRCVS